MAKCEKCGAELSDEEMASHQCGEASGGEQAGGEAQPSGEGGGEPQQ